MEDTQKNFSVRGRSKAIKISPFMRNLLIAVALLAVASTMLIAWLIFRPSNNNEDDFLFDIEVISELTTLECRYHNVSVRDIEGNFIGVGEQYVWFEYDVVIDVGIDINEVRIEEPTEDGVVKIYLPPAKILGAKAEKETISKPVCELGPFTEITADEELQIINEGVDKLKNDSKTQDVIYQAHNSAKNVLEQYVVNMGKAIGKDYRVEWAKAPDEVQITTTIQVETETE